MGAVGQIQFLASVRNVDEALAACEGGADIIDCKDPATGALGALPHAVVADIRRAVPAATPVSATIGDLPSDPLILTRAVSAMAATGVEIVKIGILPGGDATEAIAALGECDLDGARLVAVLFADLAPDLSLIEVMAAAGFSGVMLDTAGKTGGSLMTNASIAELSAFVTRAHGNGLFAGLAGSLRHADIPAVATAQPDVMGFRGALCAQGHRRNELDPAAVRAIANAVAPHSARHAADPIEPEAAA